MLERLGVGEALQTTAAPREFGDLFLQGEAEWPRQWHALSLSREGAAPVIVDQDKRYADSPRLIVGVATGASAHPDAAR